jgi:hypothetical protein
MIPPNTVMPIGSSGFKYWSAQHIQSAARLTADAHAIEQVAAAVNADLTAENYSAVTKYRACVTGAVFSSVAFLEAAINEVFAQSQPYMHAFRGVAGDDVTSITGAAPIVLGRRGPSMLDKYQLACTLLRRPKLDPGHEPFQSVYAIVSLRNELIHYVPEWVDVTNAPQRLVQLLWNKFPLSPFEPEGIGQHLDRCISYGCARWAVEASLAFADEFFARTGLSAFYQISVPHARTLLP